MKFTYHSIRHYLISILIAIVTSSENHMTIGGTLYAFQNCSKTEITGMQIHIAKDLGITLK